MLDVLFHVIWTFWSQYGISALRILRVSEPSAPITEYEHRTAIGVGGHRIDMGKNLWQSSALKIESALTDVAWGHQSVLLAPLSSIWTTFKISSIWPEVDNKLSRWRADSLGYKQSWSGEIRYTSIKASKHFYCWKSLERRIKDHTRAINKLSYSHVLPYLCITGSADGDLRVWVSSR